MAGRYIKLYELPGGLYAAGAPVMIRAGALLQDTFSHNTLVQLKLYNLDERTIQRVKLSIRMLDARGGAMGVDVARAYTRLKAGRDTEFGHRTALILPLRDVAAFSVRVTEVLFADGTRWKDRGEIWENVARPMTLRDAYGSEEIATQFRIRYGTDCRYAPQDNGALWQCTCGFVNQSTEKSCHGCHRVRKALLNVNKDSLRHECEQRLKNEGRLLSEEAADGDLAPDDAEKKRPLLRALSIALPLVVVLLAVILLVPRVLDRIVPLPEPTPLPSPDVSAEPAVTPELAVTPEPTPTPVPTLSPEAMQKALYDQAVSLLDSNHYSEARSAFLQLGDYADSVELAQEAVYRKAMALYTFIEQYDEKDIYAVLSLEAGGGNRFSLSTQKALDLGSPVIDALRAACGGDAADIHMEDSPSEALKPLAACVKELFSLLGSYRDSSERLAALEEMTDYTRDFYMLCEAGDIYGAYNWLANYTGDFPGRDHWLQLLELYKPFCDNWLLSSGDYTLLPLTVEHAFPCTQFNSRVIVSGDTATLRLLIPEGESEFYVDLYAETGTTNFSTTNGVAYYSAAINQIDHLAYMKFIDGSLVSSCEYARAR